MKRRTFARNIRRLKNLAKKNNTPIPRALCTSASKFFMSSLLGNACIPMEYPIHAKIEKIGLYWLASKMSKGKTAEKVNNEHKIVLTINGPIEIKKDFPSP